MAAPRSSPRTRNEQPSQSGLLDNKASLLKFWRKMLSRYQRQDLALRCTKRAEEYDAMNASQV